MINNAWGRQALRVGAGGSRAAVDPRGPEAAGRRDVGRKAWSGREINKLEPPVWAHHPPLPSQAATSEKQMQGLHATGGWVWASQVFINPAQVGLAGPLGGSARP